MTDELSHTTAHELKFIDGLGFHGEHSPGRREMLIKYLRAIKKRSVWADLDKEKVIAYAHEQLQKLVGKNCLSFDELTILRQEAEEVI